MRKRSCGFGRGSHCAVHALEIGCSCAAPGDQSRMMHPRLGGALGVSSLLQVMGLALIQPSCTLG